MILQTTNTAVMAEGAQVLLSTDKHAVDKYPFYRGNTPSPCLTVIWANGTTTTKAMNVSMLTYERIGICLPNPDQGHAIIKKYQKTVSAK